MLSSRLYSTHYKTLLPVSSGASNRQSGSKSSTERLPNVSSSSQAGKPRGCSVTKSTAPSSHAMCSDGGKSTTKELRPRSKVSLTDRTAPVTLLPSVSNRRLGAQQRASRDYLSSQSRRAGIPSTSRGINRTDIRDVLVKPQVSTSSRPSLIKTGSLPQSSNLPRMNVAERPKPLRRTSEQPTGGEIAGKNIMTRPKWV